MVAKNEPQQQDVEMESAEDIENQKRKQDLAVVQKVFKHSRQIEKAVLTKEPWYILRVLRLLPNIRRKLNTIVLRNLTKHLYPAGVERDSITRFLDGLQPGQELDVQRARATIESPIPEVDAYLHLLVLVFLLDKSQLDEAQTCCDALIKKIVEHIRRSSTVTLRNHFEYQAVLINCLLRNYLHYSLYNQADELVKKSVFPETASNNEWARFLYYSGHIKAAKFKYSEAHKNLVQALQKSPQNAAIKMYVQKLIIVVELLLGKIPKHQILCQAALIPYVGLIKAVGWNNLRIFNGVLKCSTPIFQQDHSYTLIMRLRDNLVGEAIRLIDLSYSCISLEDIAEKLGLDNADDAESIVRQAIGDGIMLGTIDPEKGYIGSGDKYIASVPMFAFERKDGVLKFSVDGIQNIEMKRLKGDIERAAALIQAMEEADHVGANQKLSPGIERPEVSATAIKGLEDLSKRKSPN